MTATTPMLGLATPGEANGYVGGKNTTNLTVSRLSMLQRWILDRARQNRLKFPPGYSPARGTVCGAAARATSATCAA
jgi:hypothetical protein